MAVTMAATPRRPPALLSAAALALALAGVALAQAATTNAGHRERAQDGAFSPREHDTGEGHNDQFDHEAILGSKKDAVAFDDLAPEEAKRRLRLLLSKMDRNGDERIDKTELNAWIVRSFKMLNVEEANERFDDSDGDQDGFISWEEYKNEEFDDFDEDVSADSTDPEVLEELQMLAEDKVLFTAADEDGDGRLSRKEFEDFSHPEQADRMKPVVIENLLKEKDENGDGEITFSEYVGERASGKPKDWLVTEKERFDDELDVNGDGALDASEILAWIIPSDEDSASEEAEHLFAGADDDVDGTLTFDEIVGHHDLFVGSEATDYGEHLANLHKFDDEL